MTSVSVSAAADRRRHLAVDIWGFPFFFCLYYMDTAPRPAPWEPKLSFCGRTGSINSHVRRIFVVSYSLQTVAGTDCLAGGCCVTSTTVPYIVPGKLDSACFSYGSCQCFWLGGQRRGKIGCSLPRRSGQIERAVCNEICLAFSAARAYTVDGRVRLSVYFRTRSTQPSFSSRGWLRILGVLFFFPSFFSQPPF